MSDCDTCGTLLPGVIEAMDTPEGVQRCDSCDLYPGDLEAAAALAATVDGEVHFIRSDGREVVWDGEDLPPGLYIAGGTNPWVVADGREVNWLTHGKASPA